MSRKFKNSLRFHITLKYVSSVHLRLTSYVKSGIVYQVKAMIKVYLRHVHGRYLSETILVKKSLENYPRYFLR